MSRIKGVEPFKTKLFVFFKLFCLNPIYTDYSVVSVNTLFTIKNIRLIVSLFI